MLRCHCQSGRKQSGAPMSVFVAFLEGRRDRERRDLLEHSAIKLTLSIEAEVVGAFLRYEGVENPRRTSSAFVMKLYVRQTRGLVTTLA